MKVPPRATEMWRSEPGSDKDVVRAPAWAVPQASRRPVGEAIPTSVYRLFDSEGSLLYVGITHRGWHRLHQHARDKSWWSDVARAEFEHYPDREAAARSEAQAIVAENPVFNIVRGAWAPSLVPTLASGLVRASVEGDPGGSLLEDDEHAELLDRQTRRYFRMSGVEFLEAFRAGDIDRDDERLRYVANLLTRLPA